MIAQDVPGCGGNWIRGWQRAAWAWGLCPSRTAPAKPMPRAPELSRSRTLTVYTISFGLWLTGAVWLLAHYFLVYEGGSVPSPSAGVLVDRRARRVRLCLAVAARPLVERAHSGRLAQLRAAAGRAA